KRSGRCARLGWTGDNYAPDPSATRGECRPSLLQRIHGKRFCAINRPQRAREVARERGRERGIRRRACHGDEHATGIDACAAFGGDRGVDATELLIGDQRRRGRTGSDVARFNCTNAEPASTGPRNLKSRLSARVTALTRDAALQRESKVPRLRAFLSPGNL